MSNKTIKIDLRNASTIADAIKEVRAYRQMIVDGSKKLVDTLADEAVQKAQRDYSTAKYAGDNDVSVSRANQAELHTTITASGEAALFIEFGTGIKKADAPEARADLKSGNVVGHGQYGHHLGRMKNGWRYKGTMGANPPEDTFRIEWGRSHYGEIVTLGNDATPALYMAKKHAKDRLPDLVKEVFK